MRILISAYACEPGRGSEPGIGWDHVCQTARHHDVWVITRCNNRAAIEKALARDPIAGLRCVYFDLPYWARFWKKGARGLNLYYYLWQIGAYLTARGLHHEVKFDLAHHVTFGSYWRPTFLPLLPIPFIWGPVGGGESTPGGFHRAFSMRGRLYEALRDYARKIGERDPFVRLAARRSVAALATTSQTKERLLALGCRKVAVCAQSGLPAEELVKLMALPLRHGNPFRVLSLGRLLHWKGFELGLQAFARFHALFPDSEYWLIGDGPERKRLERLGRKLGIRGRMVFWGVLARSEALEKISQCDVLLHPSLHDSSPMVAVEAMAAGRPVVCLDLGGPALQVTEDSGIKVPATSPEQVVSDLAAAMMQLAEDPDLRIRLGVAARQRVREHFAWDQKGVFMANMYGLLKEDEIERFAWASGEN